MAFKNGLTQSFSILYFRNIGQSQSIISKTVQSDLTFIFDVLSEYVIHFLSNAVSLAVKNYVSFT